MVRLVEDPCDGFLRIRVDGSWVAPKCIYFRHNGEWLPINALRVMRDGEWHAVFIPQLELQAV